MRKTASCFAVLLFMTVGAATAAAQDTDPTQGCPDQDGDLLCDDQDACPSDAANDADQDGLCGDVDACPTDPANDLDGDGLCAASDACPADPANDADRDGLCADVDACPLDVDADGDGACGEDNCPAHPNPDQLDRDADGLGDACDDHTPPTLWFGVLPNATNQRTIEIMVISPDPNDVPRLTVRVEGGATVPFVLDDRIARGTVTLVNEGENLLIAEATDDAGNVATTSAVVVLDTIAPQVDVLTPAPGTLFSNNVVVMQAAVTDATSTSVYSPDYGWVTPPGSSVAYGVWRNLPDGPSTLSLRVVDAAGNATVIDVPVVIDLYAPIITTNPLEDLYGPLPGHQLLVTATVDEANTSTVSFRTAAGSSSVALAAGGGVVQRAVTLVPGDNLIEITVVDAHGRSASVSQSVTYDVVGPTGTVLPVAAWTRGTIEVAADVRDDFSTVESVDIRLGATTSPATQAGTLWTASLDTRGAGDGTHTLTIEALDAAGNRGTFGATLRVDNTAPTAAFASTTGQTSGNRIRVDVTGADATSGVAGLTIAVEGTTVATCATATCSALVDPATLPAGPFTVTASATDAAGNVSAVIERELTAAPTDTTAPSRFLVLPRTGQWSIGWVTIVVNVTAPDFAWTECSVDGVSLGRTTQRAFLRIVSLEHVLDGQVAVSCTAADRTGNRGTETAVIELDRWIETFNPHTLNLKSSGKKLTMRVFGYDVALLLPRTDLSIAVPGGTRIPVIARRPCWQGGHDEDDDDCTGRDRDPWKVLIKFDRNAFIASVRAAIASGRLDASRPVTVTLYAGSRVVGGDTIHVKK